MKPSLSDKSKMPKKFAGMNSKAAAAKARKDEKAEAERTKKQQALDDAYWADDDKGAQKKKDRKEAAERKKADQLAKKQEAQRLLQEEEAQLKSSGANKGSKVTRNDIRLREEAEKEVKAKKKANDEEAELTENLNRVSVEGEEARTVDEAIRVLKPGEPTADSADKHPEKRMKAAFEAFEKERLPQLKEENPTLRLSQLKQILRKEWMKHPSNPFNKNLADYKGH